MARVATLSIRDHVDNEILGELARIWCIRPIAPAFLDPDRPIEDDELEPFQDWDLERGHGRGFFHSDPRECATRRVDLRGPTDLDPGPLPMEEPPAELSASVRHLSFTH